MSEEVMKRHCRSCKAEQPVKVEESGAGVKVIRCEKCDTIIQRSNKEGVFADPSAPALRDISPPDVGDDDPDANERKMKTVKAAYAKVKELNEMIQTMQRQGFKCDVSMDNGIVELEVYVKVRKPE